MRWEVMDSDLCRHDDMESAEKEETPPGHIGGLSSRWARQMWVAVVRKFCAVAGVWWKGLEPVRTRRSGMGGRRIHDQC